jgi:hypothetical protein
VLVKGQPNVSYICSRYYRAPELMFGATEYACSVDMWSIGTIMVELLLGHLPFQGQDSTQQHLVEIMKLLGTPTDRELKAMRATCSVDELPKLKAYPWERVFPAGTPQRAMDLARKLLCYDPSQRLTAAQALAHPFLQDSEFLLQGRTMPTAPDAAKEFQSQLASSFDQYVSSRNGATLGLLPAFENAVSGLLQDEQPSVHSAVVSEVGALLKECERVELQAFGELQRKVLQAALSGSRGGGGGNGGGNGSGGGGADAASANGGANAAAAELAALQAAVQQQGGAAEVEKLRQQAAEAQQEAAALRAQLEELNAQLGARSDGGAGGAADGGAGGSEAPGSAQAAPPSAGRRALPRLGGDGQGTASPVVARQSICDGDHAAASAESSAARRSGRMHGMGSLAEDELGQLTPLGAASAREREAASAGGARTSVVVDHAGGGAAEDGS